MRSPPRGPEAAGLCPVSAPPQPSACLAFDRNDLEVEIERVWDELRIRPLPRRLEGVLARFAAFSPDVMAEGRGDNRERERDAL